MKGQKNSGWTEADERLLKHLKRIFPDDKDTALYYHLLCNEEGLTEEFADYLDAKDVKTKEEICLWLFGSENEADFYKDMEEEKVSDG